MPEPALPNSCRLRGSGPPAADPAPGGPALARDANPAGTFLSTIRIAESQHRHFNTALPPVADALHHDKLDLQFLQPVGQRLAVAPEAAELAHLALHRAVGQFPQEGDDVQHAMHVDSGDTPVQGWQSKVFHLCAPVVTVGCGTQSNHQIDRRRKARGRGLGDFSNRLRAPFVLQSLPPTSRTALRNSRGFGPAQCRSG